MPLGLFIGLTIFFGLSFFWVNLAIHFTRPNSEPKNLASWMMKRRIIIGLIVEAIGLIIIGIMTLFTFVL